MAIAISSKWFLLLMEAVEALGGSPEKAIALVTDNALELRNPRFRVPLNDLADVFDWAESELNIENIGLEISYRSRVSNLTRHGSFLSDCSSILAAAEFNNRYARLAEAIGAPTLERRGDKIFVV